MKLSQPEVERIVDKLLVGWKAQQLVQFKAPEAKVRQRMVDIFLGNLRMEEDLNREVEQLLVKYESQFQSGALDRRKMFTLVKNQLIKERRLVI